MGAPDQKIHAGLAQGLEGPGVNAPGFRVEDRIELRRPADGDARTGRKAIRRVYCGTPGHAAACQPARGSSAGREKTPSMASRSCASLNGFSR